MNYSGTRAIEHVFHAHARAISDINWSPHQPDILATCSVDTYVHLWDLREPQIRSKDQDDDRKMRPSSSFTPWNGMEASINTRMYINTHFYLKLLLPRSSLIERASI